MKNGDNVKLIAASIASALVGATAATVAKPSTTEPVTQIDTVTIARVVDGGYFMQWSASGRDAKGRPLLEVGEQVPLDKKKKAAESLFELAKETRAKPDAGY